MGLCRYFRWFGQPGALILTALLSLEALLLALCFPSLPRWFSTCGMLLSSLGDIILMHYRPITDRLPFRGFTAGAVAFMSAHGFYIASFSLAAARLGGVSTAALIVGGTLFVGLLCMLVVLNCRNATPKSGRMRLCTVYLVIISACCTAVFAYAANRGLLGAISATGAILFLASDTVIGFGEVGGLRIPHAGDLIWTLYPLGQALLIGGLWVESPPNCAKYLHRPTSMEVFYV